MITSQQPAFFRKTWDETLDLLCEARDYVAGAEQVESRGIDPVAQLRISLETSRITARLTAIMAWLMARRAIVDDPEAAPSVDRDLLRFETRPLLLDNADGQGLPPSLERLAEQSRRLYVRVARLDGVTALS